MLQQQQERRSVCMIASTKTEALTDRALKRVSVSNADGVETETDNAITNRKERKRDRVGLSEVSRFGSPTTCTTGLRSDSGLAR